ncbi:MAG: hypothetical protein AAF624_05275 [Bacteroidota bacterium]
MTTRYPHLFALLALLTFVGCDAATEDLTDPVDTAEITANAATSIANAVALDSGGALDDAASFATAFSAGLAGSDAPAASASSQNGCTYGLEFNAETVRYDRALACSWESQSGAYAASYSRAQTVQFLRDGSPAIFPDNADAATYDLVDGSGTRTRPRFNHTLTDIDGSLTVTGLNTDLVTVNGSQTRAALDVWTTEAGTRSLDHRIELTFTDVTGPSAAREDWSNAVSGTISGRYQATYTALDGEIIAVDERFTVTFGSGTLVILIDDERFEADPMSGELM